MIIHASLKLTGSDRKRLARLGRKCKVANNFKHNWILGPSSYTRIYVACKSSANNSKGHLFLHPMDLPSDFVKAVRI